MNIKEIEARSGLTRANIRFYEEEGLLNPSRKENGYRDYTESDLETLNRIKLLRALHISLEDIKALKEGRANLMDILNSQAVRLSLAEKDLEGARQICQLMQNNGVRFQTLDAKYYLDTMERKSLSPIVLPPLDTVPALYIPFRRFFARILDMYFYNILWRLFLILVFNTNFSLRGSGSNLLDAVMGLLLMLFLEPLWLSLFGTTPGKGFLGIRIASNDGGRLSYREAFHRTWSVLFLGLGFSLPIIRIVTLWKSYKKCSSGETLSWEYDSEMTLKDEKSWRAWASIGVCAALLGLVVFVQIVAEMPKHRGDITVAEFCENYNRFARYSRLDDFIYLGTQGPSYLNAGGEWIHKSGSNNGGSATYMAVNENGELVLESSDDLAKEDAIATLFGYRAPTFTFSESDGCMTGMEFSCSLRGDTAIYAPYYQRERLLSLLSFVWAQDKFDPSARDLKEVLAKVTDSPLESFEYSVNGVRIVCQISSMGYYETFPSGDVLFSKGNESDYYSFYFSMQKEGQ